MLGTTGGAVLVCVNLLAIGVIGMLVGLLATLAMRKRWGGKVALIDLLTAIFAALLAGYSVSAVEAARGVWESRLGLIAILAIAAVLLIHAVRATRQSNPRT
jgi:uncharacterized membrane protein